MKRPGYREAIEWLAINDHWTSDDEGSMSESAGMVCDLFDVPESKLIADFLRALKRVYPNHEIFNENGD